MAADAHAAGARVRHVGGGRPAAPAHDGRAARRRRPAVRLRAALRRVHLGDELRDDVRDRARDRLRAVHRGPVPRRARAGPVAAGRHGADDGHGRQGRAGQRAHRDRRAAGGHARAGPDVPLGAARDRAGRAVGPRGDPDAAARRAVRARSPDQRRAAAPAPRGRASQRALRRLGPPPVGATAAVRRRRDRDPVAPRRARARAADGDADDRRGAARRRLARGPRARDAGVRCGRAERAPGDARRARPGARHGHPASAIRGSRR